MSSSDLKMRWGGVGEGGKRTLKLFTQVTINELWKNSIRAN